MNAEQRLKVLEEEFKILKNEVKTILLDLREQYLNVQNPFNMTANASPTVMIANIERQDENKRTAESDTIKPEKNSNNSKNSQKVMEKTSSEDEFNELTPLEFPSLSPGPFLNPVENEVGMPGLNTSNALLGAPGFNTLDNISETDVYDEPVVKKNNKNGKDKEIDFPSGSGRFDLVIIAGLTQWVDQAAAKLGKERAEALVEMSCTMGRIPPNLKDVLIKMARLSRTESNGQAATATDYLALLAQLENLLGGSEIQDKALLSILSMMKGNGNG